MASIFVKNQTQASSSQNLESFLSRFALYVSSSSSTSSSSSDATSTSRDTSGGAAAAAAMTSERFAGWGGGLRRIRSESARPPPQPTHRLRFAEPRSFSSPVFAKALLERALERAGDGDSGDEEEMAKEEDQNAFSIRIIGALNSRKSALTTH